jgi:hypothetical protein
MTGLLAGSMVCSWPLAAFSSTKEDTVSPRDRVQSGQKAVA